MSSARGRQSGSKAVRQWKLRRLKESLPGTILLLVTAVSGVRQGPTLYGLATMSPWQDGSRTMDSPSSQLANHASGLGSLVEQLLAWLGHTLTVATKAKSNAPNFFPETSVTVS